MAAILPLAAIGAFAVYSNRSNEPVVYDRTDEERVAQVHQSVISEYGISASANHALLDKQVLMGGIINDGVGVDNRTSLMLYDPSFDPLALLGDDAVQLASFDRWDTEFATATQQSLIVPRRNNAIAIALTEEIRHPDDMWSDSSRSALYVSKFSPAFANQQQIQDAELQIKYNPENDHERSLRVYDASQFFETAAGQSFRYSED